MKTLVYTSNTANYDPEVENKIVPVYRETEFFQWRMASIYQARRQKMLMIIDKAAAYYDYFLYVDGNMIILDPDIIDKFIKELWDNDILFVRHTHRKTTKEEVDYLCTLDRFSYIHKSIKEQYEYYKTQGFPDDLPLPCTGMMFFKGNMSKKFFKDWYQDVRNRQPRDQVGVCYHLRTKQIKYKLLDIDFFDNPFRTGVDHTINTYRKHN